MAIVRFGSCGIVHPDVTVGDIIVPDQAIMVQQNFFDKTSGPFLISEPCSGCPELNALTAKHLKAATAAKISVATGGIVASTDSFYASQGMKTSVKK